MMQAMGRNRGFAGLTSLIVFVGLLSAASAALETDRTERLSFKVFLDDREIGYHDFTFRDQGELRTVESEARFNVKVLFINAFSYAHRTTERWSNGCLVEISARTDNNGQDLAVNGAVNAAGFLVDSNQGSAELASDCVKTFAYWNPELRNAKRLLNAQTGEYLDVAVTSLGVGQLALGDREISVERIRLTAKDTDIEIYYSAETGEWVALDSLLKQGRTLSYRRVTPAATVLAKS